MIKINEDHKILVRELEDYLSHAGYFNEDGLLTKDFYVGKRLAKSYTPIFNDCRIILRHSVMLFRSNFSVKFDLGIKDGHVTVPIYNYPEGLEDSFKKVLKLFTSKYSYSLKRSNNQDREVTCFLNFLEYTPYNVDEHINKMVERNLPKILRQAEGLLRPVRKGRI